LASKTMAVSLPVVLLILDWYPLRRIRSVKDFTAVLIEKIPFIAGSLLISLISFTAQKMTGALVLMDVTPLSVRVLVAFRALMTYLWKMIAPFNLLPFYPYPENVSILSIEYFSAIVLISGITAVCIFYAKKQKAWLSLWAYYVITLLPVLGLVQVGIYSMADRFTYLPSLGPFLFLGLIAAWVWRKAALPGKQRQTAGLFAIAITITLFIFVSFLTLKQIAIWKSSIDFWNYVVEKEPRRVPTAYLNRGLAYGDRGEFDRAMEDFDMALTINPRYGEAHLNRGMAFVAKGQFDRALEDYNAAIAAKPGYIDAYNNRGSLFNRKGQFDLALEDLNVAITMNPAYFAAYVNRGIAYKEMGELDRAIVDYNKALSLSPDFVKIYVGRGDIYMKKGDIELAVKDYQKACDLGSEDGCRKALFPTERR
jgi:protein O-mannosyl-transferase